MASQDNPEQGLCHHPSADRPIPEIKAPSKPKKNPNGSVEPPGNGGNRDTLAEREEGNVGKVKTVSTKKPHPLGSNKPKKRAKISTPKDEEPKEKVTVPMQSLEEPTTTDHRSFVQNVFGTTAFKMLEWLTPRSLEVLSRSEETAKPAENGESKTSAQDARDPGDKEGEGDAPENSSSPEYQMPHEPGPTKLESKSPKLKPSLTNGTASPAVLDSRAPCHPVSRRKSSSSRCPKSDSLDTQPQKGILNIPSRTPDTAVDMTLPQFRPSHPKQKLSRQSSITSPQMHVAEITSVTGGKPASVKIITEPKRTTSKNDARKKEEPIATSKTTVEKATLRVQPTEPRPVKNPAPPQSVSHLPIDLINFLCDVLQTDRTAEMHDLKPSQVVKMLVRWQDKQCAYQKGRDPKLRECDPAANRERWRIFVQQSLFDVLSKPNSLLRSFRDDEGQLFDTHTIWYLLLRMTRVTPSLVFHSLWNVAGALFNPPEKLETIHDWAKESQNSPSRKSLSNQEAAEVMSICLHALVATAPLVSNARQLANMSRIRSYGLTMLGRDKSSLEPAALCLQYEDAFSNELALRLARRVFASIPTRRRFTELMDVQNDVRNDGEREPDVLEAVLAKLKFLDLETPPVLSFTLDERDLHEKRVPTLLLDWARTVMLQDWQGSAEVSAEGAFGGALALIAAICMCPTPLLAYITDYSRQTQKVVTSRRYPLPHRILCRTSRSSCDASRMASIRIDQANCTPSRLPIPLQPVYISHIFPLNQLLPHEPSLRSSQSYQWTVQIH
jgi:hypothetical protein